MTKDLDTKKKYAEKYGPFFGAVLYLIKSKSGKDWKPQQEEGDTW